MPFGPTTPWSVARAGRSPAPGHPTVVQAAPFRREPTLRASRSSDSLPRPRADDTSEPSLPSSESSGSRGGGALWRVREPELEEHAEAVGDAPVLDDALVLDAKHVEDVGAHRAAGRRMPHE